MEAVLDVTDEMRIAQEEIFGPILPVRTYRSFDEIFDFLSQRPRPLVLYYFDRDRSRIDRILRETRQLEIRSTLQISAFRQILAPVQPVRILRREVV
jgi:acyl-CoA reductase-like NAD-dependent aldehyde dehydrogenase